MILCKSRLLLFHFHTCHLLLIRCAADQSHLTSQLMLLTELSAASPGLHLLMEPDSELV